ncbi:MULTISPECIES: hypothetical protein [Lonepinella]|uniref:hypothetical protein n=1 Tax=Lonepinella TaxID=53416 RepID=UPI0012AB24EB|nr:hypothetical protein [Lonepinella koalarum]
MAYFNPNQQNTFKLDKIDTNQALNLAACFVPKNLSPEQTAEQLIVYAKAIFEQVNRPN